MAPDVTDIVEELRRSRKYGHLCADTLERIARWAVARHPSAQAAAKAAKRKLHQVHGAYVDQVDLARVDELLEALPGDPSGEALRTACGEILRRHASTAERLPHLAALYGALFGDSGPPRCVLDIACGLHPFAIPWMGLPPGARYHAMDIDCRLVGALTTFFRRLGAPHTAECRDALVSLPEVDADVVFLLKALPCLEQQERGASLRLLQRLHAPRVVVSFPTRTLGGRDVGMYRHYGAFIAQLADNLGASLRELRCPNETFYLLRIPASPR